MIVYKILEPHRGEYRTLFHGVNSCRILPIGEWIKAEKRMVKDGSGGKLYLSGFHCFKDAVKGLKYLNKFTNALKYRVIECYGIGLRQKPTNKDVYLADEIMIPAPVVQ